MDGFPIDVVLSLRVLGYPAPDMPATWIAHALDLDIVAQGSSPDEATKFLRSAVSEMIAYRLSAGLSPIEWSPAAEELWAAAEAASGETLDRRHPRLLFESPGAAGDEVGVPPTRLFVTDRIPVRAAHAG